MHCSICSSEYREAIDRECLLGEKHTVIARRYGVSADAIGRHRQNHSEKALATARDLREVAYGDRLLAQVGAIRADAERLQKESEGRRDMRAALAALKQRAQIAELEARLQGRIRSEGSKTVNMTTNNMVLLDAAEVRRRLYKKLGVPLDEASASSELQP